RLRRWRDRRWRCRRTSCARSRWRSCGTPSRSPPASPTTAAASSAGSPTATTPAPSRSKSSPRPTGRPRPTIRSAASPRPGAPCTPSSASPPRARPSTPAASPLPGAVEFLVSVLRNHATASKSAEDLLELSLDSPTSTSSPEEDALSVICSLKPSKKSLIRILEKNGDFLDTLVYMLRRPSYRSRCYGILLLKAMMSVMEPVRLMAVKTEVVQEVVRVVSDRVSAKAVKAALNVLCRLCPWGRNRVKAVEAGAMTVLVELLLDEGGRHPTELAVVAIDHLCGCAEGRSDLVAHPAGLAVVAKKAMRISLTTTESAVRALHAVARHSPTPAVLQEMLAVGVVAKLLLVLQVDAGERARAKAKELLKMHARVWKDSPCMQAHLKARYPC
uniref:U-box domain-containing protein n=1 Tax=Aegilops tauschii subsp. strangulata TaxID=200361 RepID=A0A453Q114_AEGTS